MEMRFYQLMLVLSATLFAGILGYLRHKHKRFVQQLAKDKQHEGNLRRELHDTNEKHLRQKEQATFFSRILASTDEALLVFPIRGDAETDPCSYANKAACTLLEIQDDDWQNIECTQLEYIPADDPTQANIAADPDQIGTPAQQAQMLIAQNRIRRQIHTLERGGEIRNSTEYITAQNHLIPVHMHAHLLQMNNERYLVQGLRLAQKERSLQKSLKAAERRYRQLFQSSLIGIARYDAKHKLMQVNPAWLRMWGSPSLEDMQQFDLFSPQILPQESLDQVNRGENIQIEIPADFDYWIKHYGFITNRRRKAVLVVFIQNLGRDDKNEPRGYMVQVMDITALRENEAALEMRQKQLLQSQKMASIGLMTGGIAHDFNNILTPILGYSEIGMDFCQDNPMLKEFITEINTATLRAKELVRQILIYSRQSDDAASEIHLTPIVKEVAKQQESMLAPEIEVRTNFRTKDDLVLINPTQMHQVLTNLATNAAFAMRENGGTLDFQLSTFKMGWRHRQEYPELPKGTYVRITIKDTGVGIPDDIRDRIFNPFFSTKPHGEGTGMGLAVVQSIIDAANGGIALESAEGEGSTFHIALPLIEVEKDFTSTDWTPPPTQEKTILFVDDEPGILRVAKPLLSSIGYEPETCAGYAAALKEIQNPKRPIHAMICDVIMPEGNGQELAEAVHAQLPELPIVFLTGYPERVDFEAAQAAGVRACLIKPVTRQELSETLSRVLEGENLLASPPAASS